MDRVDHGPEFVSRILSEIKMRIEKEEGHIEGVPLPSLTSRHNRGRGGAANGSPPSSHTHSSPRILTSPSPPFSLSLRQDVPSSSSPLSPLSASLSKPARKTNVRFQDDPAAAPLLSPSNSAAMYKRRESAAKRERSMRREQNIQLIETLQRLNETPTTVYYLGSLHLRMKTLSDGLKQALHDIWFDPFRLIYNNMHNEAEAWLIPLKSLIELGMMVEV
jgi:hypothetical protein